MDTREDHSLSALTIAMTALTRLATGEVTPALNRGFWLRIADNRVEPDRGRPVMK